MILILIIQHIIINTDNDNHNDNANINDRDGAVVVAQGLGGTRTRSKLVANPSFAPRKMLNISIVIINSIVIISNNHISVTYHNYHQYHYY